MLLTWKNRHPSMGNTWQTFSPYLEEAGTFQMRALFTPEVWNIVHSKHEMNHKNRDYSVSTALLCMRLEGRSCLFSFDQQKAENKVIWNFKGFLKAIPSDVAKLFWCRPLVDNTWPPSERRPVPWHKRRLKIVNSITSINPGGLRWCIPQFRSRG